jgi:hypothetical protein
MSGRSSDKKREAKGSPLVLDPEFPFSHDNFNRKQFQGLIGETRPEPGYPKPRDHPANALYPLCLG